MKKDIYQLTEKLDGIIKFKKPEQIEDQEVREIIDQMLDLGVIHEQTTTGLKVSLNKIKSGKVEDLLILAVTISTSLKGEIIRDMYTPGGTFKKTIEKRIKELELESARLREVLENYNKAIQDIN